MSIRAFALTAGIFGAVTMFLLAWWLILTGNADGAHNSAASLQGPWRCLLRQPWSPVPCSRMATGDLLHQCALSLRLCPVDVFVMLPCLALF